MGRFFFSFDRWDVDLEFEGAPRTKSELQKEDSVGIPEHILLCRPLGGLNDVLCQIEYSRKLAISLGRSLVVVTEPGSPGLSHRFEIPFLKVFAFSPATRISQAQVVIGAGIKEIDNRLANVVKSGVQLLSKSMSELTGGVQEQCRLSLAEGLRQRKTRVLLHESWGGGLRSATLLKHLAFVPELESQIKRLWELVPESAVGLHFRNSDYKSDAETLMNELMTLPRNRTIIVGSDDEDVLAMLRSKLPNRRLLSASSFIETLAFEAHPTIKALLELMVLAFCDKLIVIPLARTKAIATLDGDPTPSFSGFARLAKHVWAVRKTQRMGFFGFIGTSKSLQGLSGFHNPVLKLLHLALFQLPRIFIQARFPAGVYRQLSLFGPGK